MKQNNVGKKAESAKIKAESVKMIKWKKLSTKQNWPFFKAEFSDLCKGLARLHIGYRPWDYNIF